MKKQQTAIQSGVNLKPIAAAAIVASCIMLGHGLVYRAVGDYLDRPVTANALDPDLLEQFPLAIGKWIGRAVPLDPNIVARTDTDAHINRAYVHEDGLSSLWLYAACGVKVRDLAPHRPEVCYTGSGWNLAARQSMGLPLEDGRELKCRLFKFSRGTISAQEVLVLYYYIVDGRFCSDVSELRFNFWRIGQVAQIQIGTTISQDLTAETASKMLCDFATLSAPQLSDLMGPIRQEQGSSRTESKRAME